MNDVHHGPGRRFATGSSRGDQLLGAFGLVSHLFTFCALAFGVAWLWPERVQLLCMVCTSVAVLLLVVRAMQVGATTTKESIKAIREAWGK